MNDKLITAERTQGTPIIDGDQVNPSAPAAKYRFHHNPLQPVLQHEIPYVDPGPVDFVVFYNCVVPRHRQTMKLAEALEKIFVMNEDTERPKVSSEPFIVYGFSCIAKVRFKLRTLFRIKAE